MKANIEKLKKDVAALEADAAEALKSKELSTCPHAASLRARLGSAVDSCGQTIAWLEDQQDQAKDQAKEAKAAGKPKLGELKA